MALPAGRARHLLRAACGAAPATTTTTTTLRSSTAAAVARPRPPDADGAAGGPAATGGMPRLRALRERLRAESFARTAAPATPAAFPAATATARVLDGDDGRPAPARVAVDGHVAPSAHDRAHARDILTDLHGRRHNYLRISLSERCNLRCRYCMPPEGVPLSPSPDLLADDEILRLVRLFARNGVDKVRLTGGEPLLRPGLVDIVRGVSDALGEARAVDHSGDAGRVGITTNGLTLSRNVDALVDAGLTSVNVSLDTLRSDRFAEITRRRGLDRVLGAIDDAIGAFRRRHGSVRTTSGASRVKVNCVVMNGFNDDELGDFVDAADGRFGGAVDVRFIEWMPFNDNGWNAGRFLSYGDMVDRIEDRGRRALERIGDGPNDTTKWWRARRGDDAGRARVGFITSMSEHFCASCNRLRITADGKIKVCLFGSNEKEVSLRDVLREDRGGDWAATEEELSRVIRAAVHKKTFALGGHGSAENIAKAADNRPMTLIGG